MGALNKFAIMTAAFLCASAGSVGALADKDVADIYAAASNSVVFIVAVNVGQDSLGQGSGVVVSPAKVITNCHVLKGMNEVGVLYQGVVYKAPRVLDSNVARDLCLLSVPELPAPAIEVGTSTTLRVGESVLAIGAPHGIDLGAELTLSQGLISSLRRQPNEAFPIIQTSAPISPGSSGGALLDQRGRLIGITTFVHATGQNLNFAVPVDWVRELPAARIPEFRHRDQIPD